MARVVVKKSIAAPAEDVFETVAHIEEFSQVVPEITKIEFLSDQKTGVGTRFRETRMMKGKEAATELEVTEYEPPRRVRIVADSHGTVWDTVFNVSPAGEGAELEMVMDARAYKLLSRLMNPLICGMIKKFVDADMEAVKEHCEKQASEHVSSQGQTDE